MKRGLLIEVRSAQAMLEDVYLQDIAFSISMIAGIRVPPGINEPGLRLKE